MLLNLFVDSNVLIEAVFLPRSAAAAITDLAIEGTVNLMTCEQVIFDVEKAIVTKLEKKPQVLDQIIERWHSLRTWSRLAVLADEPYETVKSVYDAYIALMRHTADIVVLAAAIKAKPTAILSSNREHFNDFVSKKCGIPICTCAEFLELVGVQQTE